MNLPMVDRLPGESLAALAARQAEAIELARNPAPEPLRRPTPPPEPYPVGELGPILGPACESLRRVVQAPDAVCGASLLAAASLATQGLADVHIDGRVIPLSLWLLTVAESGERKSAVDAEAMRPAREFEHELGALFADNLNEHAVAIEEWNARRDAARSEARRAQGNGLADKLRDIGAEPEPPLQPRVTVADFTAEGLFKLLQGGVRASARLPMKPRWCSVATAWRRKPFCGPSAHCRSCGIAASWIASVLATVPRRSGASGWRCTCWRNRSLPSVHCPMTCLPDKASSRGVCCRGQPEPLVLGYTAPRVWPTIRR